MKRSSVCLNVSHGNRGRPLHVRPEYRKAREIVRPVFGRGLFAVSTAARVAAYSMPTFAVCSLACTGKMSRQSLCISMLLLEPFSGFFNGSSGMRKKCVIGIKGSWPKGTVIPKQSAVSTRPGLSRAVNIPPMPNASRTAIVAKSRTALPRIIHQARTKGSLLTFTS